MSELISAPPAEELRAMAQRLLEMAEDAADAPAGGSKAADWSHEAGGSKLHPARLLAMATGICKARRARSELFGTELFADPAWDILLGLFVAELRGERLSTSSLCTAAAVPQSTGLRWIGHLEKTGLVSGDSCERDGRIQWRSLTPKGSRLMREFFDKYWSQVCSPTPQLTVFQKYG